MNLGFAEMFLNNVNVEKEIRTLEVSQFVSKIATISEVRKKLVSEQQEMGKQGGIVMDGRDIGTVVFPNAHLKLFMTASADKRATRRYNELIAIGDNVSFEDILFNVQERDRIDSTRKDSPLIMADDAIEFDNSDMGITEQFDKICSVIDRIIL
jgi:cytidylate kinase